MLDIYSNAIRYASNKNKKLLSQLNCIRVNIIKYTSSKKYDLTWSAGLFDYLDDRLFVLLLQRFYLNLEKNGQLIIGNFSPLNPTIKVMEVRTQWYLNYRNEVQLKSLAKAAEIIDSTIKVAKEPLGINLFLQIQSYG